jgi:hypothetical protein
MRRRGILKSCDLGCGDIEFVKRRFLRKPGRKPDSIPKDDYIPPGWPDKIVEEESTQVRISDYSAGLAEGGG